MWSARPPVTAIFVKICRTQSLQESSTVVRREERGIAEKNNVLFWPKQRRTQASPSPYNIHMRKEAVNLGRQNRCWGLTDKQRILQALDSLTYHCWLVVSGLTDCCPTSIGDRHFNRESMACSPSFASLTSFQDGWSKAGPVGFNPTE